MTMRIGELCAGYGGLAMAVTSVLGGELAWVADNDPGAAKILGHRFPQVPNLGDIAATDWAAVEPVDILTAGFPCQPVSAAGMRKGLADERWLFDDIAEAVGRMVARPRLLVLENVPGLLSANGGDAMERVVQGLAALGYVGRYRLLRASDAEAPHRRERWFCTAWPAADAGGERRNGRPGGGGDGRQATLREQARDHRLNGGRAHAEDPDRAAGSERRLPAPGQAPGRRPRADAGRPGGAPAPDAPVGPEQRQPATTGFQSEPRHGGADPELAADTERGGRDGGTPLPERGPAGRVAPAGSGGSAVDWGPYAAAIARWERVTGRPAPRPTEPGRTGERLSPRFVEWLMGLPAGWVTDVPGLSRNAQLKALGNGVVVQQAAMALRLLLGDALGEAA